MKRLALIGMALFVLVLVFIYAQYDARHVLTAGVVDLRGQAEVSIILTEKGFVPQRVIITQGTKVTFSSDRNVAFWPASDPHPTHTDYPAFDPQGPIDASSTWSFVFDRLGEWGYHDHVRSYFTGTIYVEAPNAQE